MANEIEQAVTDYVQDRSAENLSRLDHALVEGTFVIPVSRDALDMGADKFDIPAICLRREDGTGVLPAFTSIDNLLAWKPEGSKYVELGGRKLLEMARGMAEVDEVAVNPNGVHRGSIPRNEFERLLAI